MECEQDPTRETSPTEPSVQVEGQLGHLGPFDIHGTLGWGGMGVVYRARDRRDPTGEEVALKVLRIGSDTAETSIRRFRKEIEASARLDHPHIVPLLDSGGEREHLWFSMPLVDGRSLTGWLEERHRELRTRLDLIRTIALAAHHAHQQGIIHRDLKPGNIIVAHRDDAPYVADFGLARALGHDSSLTKSEEAIGTPAYMAPEQAQGHHQRCDARTDVWALGAMLYECLTGIQPFRGESAIDILAGIVNREPPPPRTLDPTLPAEVEAVVMHCLEKRMDRRYADAQDLAEDLERVAAGRKPRAPLYGWLRRHRQGLRRRGPPILVGVLLLVTLIAGGLLGYRDYQRSWGRWIQVFDLHREQEALDYRSPRLVPIDSGWQRGDHGLVMRRGEWLWCRDLYVPSDVRVVARVRTPANLDGIEIAINSAPPEDGYIRPNVPVGYSCQFGGYMGAVDFVAANYQPGQADFSGGVASGLRPETEHELVFERDGDDFRLRVDGREVLTQPLPLPVTGRGLDRIGIRTWSNGAELVDLHVYRLAPAESADPLLAGDTMVRLGHHERAAEEYLTTAAAYAGQTIAARALAKGILARLVAEGPEASDFGPLLVRLRSLPPSPLRQATLEAVARGCWSRGAKDQALDLMEAIVAADPTSRVVGQCLHDDGEVTPSQRQQLRGLLERSTGSTVLELNDLGLEDLQCIAHHRLQVLLCPGNAIGDLSPLAGMPLRILAIDDNPVSDLSPLRGMPLRSLYARSCRIVDVSPLAGLPLDNLELSGNRIRDPGPLAGLPLRKLYLGSNQIEELGALPPVLETLELQDNRIADLGPLTGVRVRDLSLDHNRIAELDPLAAIPLRGLSIIGNEVRSLAALPTSITSLRASGNPLEDLGPFLDDPPALFTLGDPRMTEALLRDARERWGDRPDLLDLLDLLAAAREPQGARLRTMARPIGERRYLAIPVALDRPAARRFAESVGAHLATVPDAATFKQLDPERSLYKTLWIGLDATPEGPGWHDGSPYDFHRLRWNDAPTGPAAMHEQFWIDDRAPEKRLPFLLAWPED